MSNLSEQVTGNKGEWSELYALLRLLGDGQLQPGNELLDPSKDSALKVLSVQRNDRTGAIQYKINDKKIFIRTANAESVISSEDCVVWANQLLAAIQAENTASDARAIPEAAKWMRALQTNSLKAKSADKADIEIVLHDLHTGAAPQLGFSVKSYLGGAPTLLNASSHTNFLYPIPSCNVDLQTRFNEKLNAADFASAFASLPAHAQPDPLGARVDSATFEQNLSLLDSQLQTIVGHLLLLSYQGLHGSRLSDLCAVIEELNPLQVPTNQLAFFYRYKIKKFLICVALGLTPATLWTGQYHANGGYVFVKRTGELVSYHVYAINQFEDYLFFNTQFEKPSMSRHYYGEIYRDAEIYLLKLNLQLRFIKR